MMKIGVTSDLHGYLPTVEPCEVLFICGDISPLNIQRNIPKMQVWLRSVFAEWINNIPCDQVIMVAGNHDSIFEDMWMDDSKKLYYLQQPTKFKIELLENNECNITSKDGVIYKIWGSPFCTIFGNWCFMREPESLQKLFSEMPANCDVVITHDPPNVGKYGTIQEGRYKGEKCGNKYLAEAIKTKHPKYVFSGHIHSADHVLGKVKGYGNTQFANVSIMNETYQPVYPILYLDI